jgi:hypothetical protein
MSQVMVIDKRQDKMIAKYSNLKSRYKGNSDIMGSYSPNIYDFQNSF